MKVLLFILHHTRFFGCYLISVWLTCLAWSSAANPPPRPGAAKAGEAVARTGIRCTITSDQILISNANTTITIDNGLRCVLNYHENNSNYLLTDPEKHSSLVYLTDTHNGRIFFTRKDAVVRSVQDAYGKGKMVSVESVSSDARITCSTSICAYEQYADVILVKSTFKNISSEDYAVRNYIVNQLNLSPPGQADKWWSFQGASYYWGQDFAFALPDSFRRENYFGLNDTRVGSGIPFTDVWNKSFGVALACLTDKPNDLFMPVYAERAKLEVSIKNHFKKTLLAPGERIATVQTAIMVHQKDFYDPLQRYSRLMKPYLPEFKKPVDYAFGSEWCTWGYRQQFKPAEILGKLDQLKSLHIQSVILDDGWSSNHGDWIPDPIKFPRGDEDFTAFVNKIHAAGFKVWAWWLPGYTDSTAKVAALHPDWLVKNRDGSNHPSYALCPAYPPVQEYFKNLVRKFVAGYKLDGLKLDFQEINAAPPCFNASHHHQDPMESYYSTPALFRNIYETAVHYNKEMLIEYCSCGIPPSVFHLPWVNMAVTSDPGIAQITQRVKMYKALLGDNFPVLEEYCGVLAGPVYPLAIGTGAIPGSFATVLDTFHQKWMTIYQQYALSKGAEYCNLYDIAFDYPESHVIKKNGKFYYAFYTHPWKTPEPTSRVYRFGTEYDAEATERKEIIYDPETYSGRLHLRGLHKNKKYRVLDYINKKELGIVNGNDPYLDISFEDYLLIEVSPL